MQPPHEKSFTLLHATRQHKLHNQEVLIERKYVREKMPYYAGDPGAAPALGRGGAAASSSSGGFVRSSGTAGGSSRLRASAGLDPLSLEGIRAREDIAVELLQSGQRRSARRLAKELRENNEVVFAVLKARAACQGIVGEAFLFSLPEDIRALLATTGNGPPGGGQQQSTRHVYSDKENREPHEGNTHMDEGPPPKNLIGANRRLSRSSGGSLGSGSSSNGAGRSDSQTVLSQKLLVQHTNQLDFVFLPVDLWEWRALLRGPDDSPYEDFFFTVLVDFATTSGEIKYPFEPPKLRFLTPVYHPNIALNGRICLNLLNDKAEWWGRVLVRLCRKSAQSSPLLYEIMLCILGCRPAEIF